MEKKQVIQMSRNYSKDEKRRLDYIAGFQAACNIVRQKANSLFNAEFCDAMEDLAEVSYMDFDDDSITND